MLQKDEKGPKKVDIGKHQGLFPKCVNDQQAKMVCLYQQCQQHPFFCSNCEDSSCQIVHQHKDKLISVSFKQFSKRVFRQRKPIDTLGDSIQSYRNVLNKLKEDVNEFIQKQLSSLQQIVKKAEEIPLEDYQLITKLKEQDFDQLTGTIMDKIWTKCAPNPQKIQEQQQTAQFIKIKEEQVKQLSQNFEYLNDLTINNIPQDQDQLNTNKKPEKSKVADKNTT